VIGQSALARPYKQLSRALRAGDAPASSLAAQLNIPPAVLALRDFGPCASATLDAVALALGCLAALADGAQPAPRWLSDPAVADLVADAVELTAPEDAEHPWLPAILAIDSAGCPGVTDLLLARAAEGSGRSDQARLHTDSCLALAPRLAPAVRDAMEYELCAGNWGRALELASILDGDEVAAPLLASLGQLREPAPGAERAGRNQPCPCGTGRKYKVCCRPKDLAGGTYPLALRAPALYAMLATYARRAQHGQVADRLAAAALGAPHAALLALDLAIFDGGIAKRFLARRGHLLRLDERQLLEDWLARPVDMYEVIRVNYGSELTLRSMTGGPDRIRQRDRLLSMTAGRLDIIVTRLLPDGEALPDGGRSLRVLGGVAKLDRGRREATRGLFTGGPSQPGADPDFPVRLVSQFVPGGRLVLKTTDGDEVEYCEATVEVADARLVWDHLRDQCLPAPEPPVLDLAGYDAYVAGLPARFLTQTDDAEIECVGKLDDGRLANLGTVERNRHGFTVTAKSVRRSADMTSLVLDAASAVGRAGKVTRQSSKSAQEMLGDSQEEDAPDSRDAMCRRVGLDAAITEVPPREFIIDESFLPIEHSAAGETAAREINRELLTRSLLTARGYDGHTPAEAVRIGGALRDRVLAMIDDCEWRLASADIGNADMMPRPDDLRRRLGVR
jgi:hypothetical protein